MPNIKDMIMAKNAVSTVVNRPSRKVLLKSHTINQASGENNVLIRVFLAFLQGRH